MMMLLFWQTQNRARGNESLVNDIVMARSVQNEHERFALFWKIVLSDFVLIASVQVNNANGRIDRTGQRDYVYVITFAIHRLDFL